MQRVPNPVPRVKHPDWLHKKARCLPARAFLSSGGGGSGSMTLGKCVPQAFGFCLVLVSRVQVQEKEDTFKQAKIDSLFGAAVVRGHARR